MIQLADFKVMATAADPPQLSYATKMLGVELEWPETKGAGVKVAVIDTGADIKHPDLQHLADAVDFTGEGPNDGNGHGTWCLGAIGARGKMTGAAPEVELYSVKGLKNNGSGETSHLLKSLEWCLANKMDIVSMSWGGGMPLNVQKQYREILGEMVKQGIKPVAAAGNLYRLFPDEDTVIFPADFPDTIAVASVNIEKRHSPFSSAGKNIDVAVAGEEVWGLWKGQTYAKVSGTSMACPAYAAALAIFDGKSMLRFNRKLTLEEARLIGNIYAEDRGEKGPDRKYGFGVFSFGRISDGGLAPDRASIDLKFEVGSTRYWKNGVEKRACLAPFITPEDRAVLSIRDVGEAFDAYVDGNNLPFITVKR
jgi:subtilisin family serine protease